MDLVVVGSSPIRHPVLVAPVAHLDRVPDFESGGSRFESCRTQIIFGPLAQLVEQQTLNLWVASSILAWLIKTPTFVGVFCFNRCSENILKNNRAVHSFWTAP